MQQVATATSQMMLAVCNRLKCVKPKMLAMIGAIVLIMVFFSIATNGAYITPRNISNLLRQTAISGILATGMVFVIVSAEIDLSVGSMMGLLGGIAAILDVWFKLPLLFTVILTLSAGLLLGLWNGWWVAYQRVPSFIVTLAGMLVYRGILVGITNGTTIAPVSWGMTRIGQSYLSDLTSIALVAIALSMYVAWKRNQLSQQKKYQVQVSSNRREAVRFAIVTIISLGSILLLDAYRGLPFPVLILLILSIATSFLASKTALGRRVYAIGGNLEASKLSGINVERNKLFIFSLNGLMVGIAALILCARLGAGSPSAGNLAELDAIAACVIGGTSLLGGSGTIIGAVIGAFIMSSLDNGMGMMDIPTFWQYIVKGTILLLAVWLDTANKRRS